MNHTKKYNTIIVEFLGAPKCDTPTPQYDLSEMGWLNIKHGWVYVDRLKFHKSWDWLIPVVKKLKNKLRERGDAVLIKQLNEHLQSFDKEGLWELCADNIEYLNDNS